MFKMIYFISRVLDRALYGNYVAQAIGPLVGMILYKAICAHPPSPAHQDPPLYAGAQRRPYRETNAGCLSDSNLERDTKNRQQIFEILHKSIFGPISIFVLPCIYKKCILGWIRTGHDIQNPFTNCRFNVFCLDFDFSAKTCVE